MLLLFCTWPKFAGWFFPGNLCAKFKKMLLDISSAPFIERSLNVKKTGDNGLLFIKQGDLFHKVNIDDILYIESDNVYIQVHTVNRKFLVRNNINQYLELLNSKSFFRVHRSYAVNIHHVQTIDINCLSVNNRSIPVSKTYRHMLLANLRLG